MWKVKTKLNGHITSSTKLINSLKKEVKLISTKWWTKFLRTGYSILNCAKNCVHDGPYNYLMFQWSLRYFKASRTTVSAKVMT